METRIQVYDLDQLNERDRTRLLRYVELRKKRKSLTAIANEMYVSITTLTNLKKKMKDEGHLVEGLIRKPRKPHETQDERKARRRERYLQYIYLKEKFPDASIYEVAEKMGTYPQLLRRTIELQKEEDARDNRTQSR